MDKKSFILYKDIKVQIDALPDEEAGQLLKAIYEYQVNGEEKELSPITAMVFLFIKQQFTRDHEKYEVRVNASRKNGSKGGRPKVDHNLKNPVGYNKTNSVKNNPTKGDTVNVTDTVNDNVTVKDKDNKEGDKSPKRKRFSPDLSFILDNEMLLIFDKWCKGKSKKYKNQIQVEAGYNKLMKLSQGSFADATEIVNNSLASNWEGLFPLKDKGKIIPQVETTEEELSEIWK